MTTTLTQRPEPNEYAPHFERYIALVPDGDLRAILAAQPAQVENLLTGLTDQESLHAYAPGKWTIKELLGHVIDAERVFAYRALRFGRNDTTALPGFEQDPFVSNANFNKRPLRNLLDEFAAVRQANMFLFNNFSEEEWRRRGSAVGSEMSARAAAYMIAGHVIYHTEILKSRYLQ